MLQKFSSNNDLIVFLKIIYYLYYNLKKIALINVPKKRYRDVRPASRFFLKVTPSQDLQKFVHTRRRKLFIAKSNRYQTILYLRSTIISSDFSLPMSKQPSEHLGE